MEKSKLTRIGSILLIIASACSIFISIGLIISAANYNFIIRYCSSLSFFSVIAALTLACIVSTKLISGVNKSTFKIFSLLEMVFTIISFALLISSFFTFDYEADYFTITYVTIVEFLYVLTFIFLVVGHKEFISMNYETELKRLQMLLEKGCISSEEYEKRRKLLIKIL